jgi:MFS family permease
VLIRRFFNLVGNFIAAVLELGCLFGALGAGVFADKVSRRTSIASACGACVWIPPFCG